MTYNPNVPASGQSLGETQPIIQQNFADINTAFNANHSPLTTNTDGKHLFLQMPEQSSAPATATDEGALYTKDTNDSNLYYRSESNGKEYQMTRALDAQFDTYFGKNAAYTISAIDYRGGFTFLPGGLIMIYGRLVNETNADPIVIKFPFSFPNSIFHAYFTAEKTGSVSTQSLSILTGSLATSGFSINHGDSHSWKCRWWAIGN